MTPLYSYFSITKVGHESENWTGIGEISLSHIAIKLPFSKIPKCLILFQGIANKIICYALKHLCAILAKISTVVIH
jgi:hypothetical protein